MTVQRLHVLAMVVLGLVARDAVAEGPAAAAPAAAAPAGVVERSRLEVQPGGKSITQLSIDNPLGDVRVEGYDGASILIETRKQAPDEEALDRLRVSLVPNPDGSVRLTTTADGGRELRRIGRSAVRIDLIIRAPRAARIEAAVSAGALEVHNMDAGGDLDTSSGPISVRNVAGGVSTHTISGATSLVQVFGSVDAQALASDLQLDTIGGDRLIASVNRGKIAGRRVRSRVVELTTTEGTIVLEAEAALRGRLVVSSLKGDVDVKLRRRGRVTIRARGMNVDLGPGVSTTRPAASGWVVAQAGQVGDLEAAAAIELRSRYGNVRLAIVE